MGGLFPQLTIAARQVRINFGLTLIAGVGFAMEQSNDRRSFLGWATCGLAAIFSAILGFPIVCYLIDPRHRKGPTSAMKLVDAVRLDNLSKYEPKQGQVRDARMDAWNSYPSDVIG